MNTNNLIASYDPASNKTCITSAITVAKGRQLNTSFSLINFWAVGLPKTPAYKSLGHLRNRLLSPIVKGK